VKSTAGRKFSHDVFPGSDRHLFGKKFIVQGLIKIKLTRILNVDGSPPYQAVRVSAVFHLDRRVGRINNSFESAAVLKNDFVGGIGKNGKIQR